MKGLKVLTTPRVYNVETYVSLPWQMRYRKNLMLLSMALIVTTKEELSHPTRLSLFGINDEVNQGSHPSVSTAWRHSANQ